MVVVTASARAPSPAPTALIQREDEALCSCSRSSHRILLLPSLLCPSGTRRPDLLHHLHNTQDPAEPHPEALQHQHQLLKACHHLHHKEGARSLRQPQRPVGAEIPAEHQAGLSGAGRDGTLLPRQPCHHELLTQSMASGWLHEPTSACSSQALQDGDRRHLMAGAVCTARSAAPAHIARQLCLQTRKAHGASIVLKLFKVI